MTDPIDQRFAHLTRYHYYFFALFFLSRFSAIWHYLNFLFLSPPMEYTCDGVLNKCPCSDPVWDHSVFTKTTQTKFNICCEKKWIISFTQSTQVFGMLVGSMAFGSMSDRFGRLITFAVSNLLVAVSGCLVSVMPNIVPFIIMRFLEGFGGAGVVVSGYVLCVEFCGVRYRETVATLVHIPINLGHMALAGVSYFIRNSDHFQLFISIPMFIPATFWFILYESPKWLLDNNKREKAIVVMEKICKFNKSTDCELVRAEIEQYLPENAPKEVMKFHHIFRNKRLCKNLSCMSYLYFVCGAGYYGVSQFVGHMGGNIHVNTAVSGMFLVPGALVCLVLINKLNRRTLLIITNVASGAFILIVICIPTSLKPTWLRVIFAGVSNSFFYMSFIVNFLYGVELFPTSARNSAFGFLSLMARIGQMIAPHINNLSLTAAGLVFGIGAILGVVVIIPLPETKNTELPTTIAVSNPQQEISQRDENKPKL